MHRIDGADAGRCYLNRTHMGERWHWTLYGASDHGDEPTLEAAQAAFKTAYEKRHHGS